MTIEDRIVAALNQTIGKDVENLGKSSILVKNYRKDLENVKAKISLDDDTVSSLLKTSLKSLQKHSTKLTTASTTLYEFESKLTTKIDKENELVEGVIDDLDKLHRLHSAYEYFRNICDIQDISNELTACHAGKDAAKIVNLYLSLCGDYESSNSCLGRLNDVDAPHLKLFTRSTSFYWHEVLKEKFSKEFESQLKAIKWPPMGMPTLEVYSPAKDAVAKLQTTAEFLFMIKIPGDQSLLHVKITPTIVCPYLPTPIEMLLKPFRQRFYFHFTGVKQTNRLDKPEWFLTQLLNWVKENHIFVGQNFRMAAIKAGLMSCNVRLEFIRGLVQLGIEKLCMDIEEIGEDEILYAHMLDEVLSFEHELKESYGYPSNMPSVINVVTQPQYLVKWLLIEERFTTDKMDDIFKAENPFQLIDPMTVEEIKVPKCADQFIRLLDGIRERYCCLPQPGHQLQFLELQLALIDNFRRRLVQLHNSGIGTTKILNTVNYVVSVLREWGENVHYLHLHAALLGPNGDEITSVFDKVIEELEHWQKKLIVDLASRVYDDIKAKSMPYRHDVWVSMPEQLTKELQMLSITAGEMFQLLVSHLHNLEKELSTNLLGMTLRLVAEYLDEFFIDSMIMNTKFSRGGTVQFNYDVTRNLFPLFGQYTRKPTQLFKKVNEACLLLTLPAGSAMLLYQTLKNETSIDSLKAALREVNVMYLTYVSACEVLERRTDICV